MTIRLYDNPGKISIFNGNYELSKETADLFAKFLINAPNEVSAWLGMGNMGERKKFASINAFCTANATFCSQAFALISSSTYECKSDCQLDLDKYESYYDFFNDIPIYLPSTYYMTSTSFNSTNIRMAFGEVFEYLQKNTNKGCFVNGYLGGESSRMDLDQIQTSVSKEMRHSLAQIACYAPILEEMSVQEKENEITNIDKFARDIFEKYSKWVYWNEPSHNVNDWQERYWGGMENYVKLLQVKLKYDPENFFSCYHCVGYERFDNEDPAICPEQSCTCSNTPNGQCNRDENVFSKFV